MYKNFWKPRESLGRMARRGWNAGDGLVDARQSDEFLVEFGRVDDVGAVAIHFFFDGADHTLGSGQRGSQAGVVHVSFILVVVVVLVLLLVVVAVVDSALDAGGRAGFRVGRVARSKLFVSVVHVGGVAVGRRTRGQIVVDDGRSARVGARQQAEDVARSQEGQHLQRYCTKDKSKWNSNRSQASRKRSIRIRF